MRSNKNLERVSDSIEPDRALDLVENGLGLDLATKAFWDNPLALYKVK